MTASISKAFEHLDRLSTRFGLFEHAEGVVPRQEHGYCTDDNARLLVVASREPDHGVPRRLGRLALGFVLGAQHLDGRCRNRMNRLGEWTDEPATDDCWGRSLWALGVASSTHPDRSIRRWARRGFDIGAQQRSPWSRAMAFAAIGAADVLEDDPTHAAARGLLADTLTVIGSFGSDPVWPWPEPRLRYANAALAEATIAAGSALHDGQATASGLRALAWLLDLETADGHLSLAGVHGRGPTDSTPQFDQQAIEAASLADACSRALAVTGDRTWIRGIDAAVRWFDGHNDSESVMYDTESGGGFDGLEIDGVNANQGAESTLALVSTMQRARLPVIVQ